MRMQVSFGVDTEGPGESIVKTFTGQNFWDQGYFVSTVGMDEETIRKYIMQNEKEDRRLD